MHLSLYVLDKSRSTYFIYILICDQQENDVPNESEHTNYFCNVRYQDVIFLFSRPLI